jgi:hypothetical protein
VEEEGFTFQQTNRTTRHHLQAADFGVPELCNNRIKLGATATANRLNSTRYFRFNAHDCRWFFFTYTFVQLSIFLFTQIIHVSRSASAQQNKLTCAVFSMERFGGVRRSIIQHNLYESAKVYRLPSKPPSTHPHRYKNRRCPSNPLPTPHLPALQRAQNR